MTREESLSIITEAIEDYVCNYVTDTAKAQKMLNAIQTLEQEPCEDAISRQAVHEAITRWAGSMSVLIALPTREVRPLLESIHKLPSVKSQEKTGHWIEQIDHEENCRTLICSNCDRPALHDGDSIWKHKFCPHCGAKMVEEQERSE